MTNPARKLLRREPVAHILDSRASGELCREDPGISFQRDESPAEETLNLFDADLAIPPYSMKETRSNRFSGVYWDDGTPPILVTQEMMTTSDAGDFESRL